MLNLSLPDFSLFPQVLFEPNALAQVPRVVVAHGERVLIVHAESQIRNGVVSRLCQALQGLNVIVTLAKVMGEPTTAGIDSITAQARANDVQVIVAVGGGSILDAGKAIAALVSVQGTAQDYLEGVGTLKHSGTCLPWIAIPTTAGTGSEASTNAVLKGFANGIAYKRSLRHPNFLPTAIFLDPTLQLGMPRAITAACALDAFSQLLEAYTSKTATMQTDAITFEGLHHMAQGMAALERGEDTIEMREHFAIAAMYSGYGLANAGLGLVHGVAGLLGAESDIPHGVVCGTLIAPAFAKTILWLEQSPSPLARQTLEKFALVAELFCVKNIADELARLVEVLDIPRLSAYGMTLDILQRVAKLGSNRNSAAQLTSEEIFAVMASRL